MNIHDPNMEIPRDDLARHVEAARAGFQSAAMDMLKTMIDAGVEDAAAAVITGALEAAIQSWVQTGLGVGNTQMQVREQLEWQVKTFHRKYSR